MHVRLLLGFVVRGTSACANEMRGRLAIIVLLWGRPPACSLCIHRPQQGGARLSFSNEASSFDYS
jgi:hypothetical protein